jgi:isoquinoline 1-oxidoreductase beta subunit
MNSNPNLNRRSFLKLSALGGTGLVLGFRLPDAHETDAALAGPLVMNMAQAPDEFVPNGYIRIAPDNTVTLIVHRSEMGQGVNTAVPMILADELEADWSTIRTEQAPADRAYGDQVTGGSQSISSSYLTLRIAGAAARAMLVTAAAQTWGVDVTECYAENGAVIHKPTGDTLTYGELAETAATLPVPESGEYNLKDPADFRLIGTPMGNINNLDFVTGKAVYASDIQLPGMLVAVLARCPVNGGSAESFDASEAEAVPGVRHIVEIGGNIAVVADNTWAALRGREALQITWDEGRNATVNTDEMRQAVGERYTPGDDPNELEAVYEVPYLAHATMEPMVCVADVREDSCEVWAPSQDRQGAAQTARMASGVSPDAIRIHVPLIGGGFGRRLEEDYVAEAVRISRAVGAPVKVFWTREDDMKNDFYHPFSLNHRRKRIDPPGVTSARSAGAFGLPTGAWRSVENFPEAFANECFIDEFAVATGQDLLETHLQANSREEHQAVIQLAAEKAGWGTPLPEGWGRGIAMHSTFGVTHVAMVAEVSVEAGTVRVHRVVCAVDCGLVVNPDTVKAQMEGGIAFGLTAGLHGEITIENGRVQQSNFHDYPLLTIAEMPTVEVYIVENDRRPTGVGEMGVPPIVPAVFNAIFDATGKRVRHIPVRPEDLA